MQETINNKTMYTYKEGLKDGVPIALGYFAVSIALGVTATRKLIPVLISLFMSMTNVTSAGQYAGIEIIASTTGTFLDIVLTQLIINSRYALMSISLSQKLDSSFTIKYRLICGFSITDEIYGVAMGKKHDINKNYFLGLMTLPYFGWALGTLIGATAGTILPDVVVSALGIALFSMFIAIIIPPATKEMGVFLVVLISVAISCTLYYTGILPDNLTNLSYIICGLFSSIICAILFPKKIQVEGEGLGGTNEE